MDDDPWHIKFREKAGPRLRVIFTNGIGGMPDNIADKLDELRRKERQLLRKKKKLLKLREELQ